MLSLPYETVYSTLKSRWSEYKLYKYKQIAKHLDKHKTLQSDEQIKTITERGNLKDYYRLCFLLSKFTNIKNHVKNRKYIEQLLNSNHNDSQIYKLIGEHNTKPESNNLDRDKAHADLYVQHITSHIIRRFPQH